MPRNILQILEDHLQRDNPQYKNRMAENVPQQYNPQTDELVNPNAGALEASALDPLSFMSGGTTVKTAKAATDKYGRYLRNAKSNRTKGRKPDMTKRTGSAALGSAFAAAVDPTTVPKAIGNAIGFGIGDNGMGSLITNASGAVSKFAVDIARAKNYRLNRIQNKLSREDAWASDWLARQNLLVDKPEKVLDKLGKIDNVKSDFFRSDVGDNLGLLYNLSGAIK